MERVIKVIIAEQLRFLHADRGQHRYRLNAMRSDVGDIQDDSAAQAEAEQVRTLDAERVHQLEDVAGVGSNRVVGNVFRRVAESGKVRCDDSMAFCELWGE